MPENEDIKLLPTDDLHFDSRNPRLAEYGVAETSSDEDIVSLLWDTMDIEELVQSITASGYFPHEPLIVVEENGKKVVIEGNRRLAAVKALLLGPAASEEKGWKVPKLDERALSNLENLPARISPGREDSWRYLGFKPEGVAQHRRHAEDCADGVGDALAGDVGGAAVNGFV